VDGNEEYDALVRRDAEDAWFEDEEPSWTAEEAPGDRENKSRQGETGIQDF
jgi:hypothetical protein